MSVYFCVFNFCWRTIEYYQTLPSYHIIEEKMERSNLIWFTTIQILNQYFTGIIRLIVNIISFYIVFGYYSFI